MLYAVIMHCTALVDPNRKKKGRKRLEFNNIEDDQRGPKHAKYAKKK